MPSYRQLSAATAAALLGLPVAVAVAQNAGDGMTAALREKLLLSEATIRGLTESLAVANGETELFKRKSDDLNERVEALGITSAGKDTEKLRSRLLAAVRDMRLLQKENDDVREHLVRLTESVMTLLKCSDGVDPKSRLKVEEDLRSAASLLQQKEVSPDNGPGLTSGTVVDFKPDLSLVVANLGSRQGVKTGMPFQVWRGEQEVATLRVVDVRDSLCGAIVQSTSTPTMTVKTGDSLRIDTTR